MDQPVQYQWDSQLNLYFASLPDARHVSNIHHDARVSVAIYSVPGPPGGNLGLQIRGVASALNCGSERDGWRRFKIERIEVWCFDSRTGRHRHQFDLSDLDLAGRPDQRVTSWSCVSSGGP